MAGNIVSGKAVGEWVAAKVGGVLQDNSTAIGLERDGQLVAGAFYENWNRRSIVGHIAIHGKITIGFVRAICSYPFDDCGVHKLIGPISSNNKKAIKFAIRIGFEEEARIKDADPDGDIILFTLTKDKCRYLGVRHGKER